jgi:regulatory protein
MPEEKLIIKSVRKKRYSQDCFVNFKNSESKILAMDIALKYGLKNDMPISEEFLDTMLAENRIIKVKQIAYKYANYKPRTELQVIQRLKQHEFSDDEIKLGLGFLRQFNLVNDEKYAVDFLKELIKKKPSGRKVVAAELRKKGISKEICEKTIADHFPDENLTDLAMQAAEKKMRMLRHNEPEKQKQSLINFLQRKGFDWQTIKNTTSKILPDDNVENL